MRALFLLIFIGFGASTAFASAPDTLERAQECPVRALNYRQAIVLRGPSPKRVLLTAESACGAGMGMPLHLQGVRLTIESDGKRFARIESPRAFYSSTQKQLVLDHVIGPVEPGCLGLADGILLDLGRKQFRSTDGWLLSLDSSWASLSCLQKI